MNRAYLLIFKTVRWAGEVVREPTVGRLAFALMTFLVVQQGAWPQAGPRVHPVSGRVIASTMSVEGADWLDRPEREREERPEKAIAALHLAPGMTVGEIGAGTGYYGLRIAPRILPGGTYYANDLQPGMLTRLQANATAKKLRNVRTILGAQDDTRLPPSSLDYVLMVDVYHELSDPQVMLRSIAKALKPNGQLVLLEFRKEDPNLPILPEHKMSIEEAVTELSAEHYTLDHKVETLPWQHMLFFRQSR